MKWLLLWVVLVIAAVVLLGWLVWGVVRRVFALGRELSRTAELVGPALHSMPEPYRPASSVLTDPSAMLNVDAGHGRGRSGHRRGQSVHRRFTADDGGRAAGRVG